MVPTTKLLRWNIQCEMATAFVVCHCFGEAYSLSGRLILRLYTIVLWDKLFRLVYTF